MADRFRALPLQRHFEDRPHHLGGFRIDDPLFLVFRRFHVPVGRLRQRLTHIPAQPVRTPDLAGDVPRVHFVHDIAERRKLVFALVGIHHIVDRDEADIVFREVSVGIVADLHVVPSETGKVFHHHGRDVPKFNVLQHLLKTRTVE